MMINLSHIPMSLRYDPARQEEIELVQQHFDGKLPKVYCDLLRTANGFVADSGVVIYGTEDVAERNETWEVAKYAPGYLVIGSDSGPRAYIMRLDVHSTEVWEVPITVMDPEDATLLAPSLLNWIEAGCPDLEPEDPNPKLVRVVLAKPVEGGITELLSLKKAYDLPMSAGELLKGSRSTPFTLVAHMTFAKASIIASRLGAIADKLVLEAIDEVEE